MTSKENVQPQQPSRLELQARLEGMEENQREARKEMVKLQREKLQKEEEVQKLSDIVSKSTTFTEERSEYELLSEQVLVKSATKQAYRAVKFLNNEAQAQKFGEMVMDLSKLMTLMFTNNLNMGERAVVVRNRANFYAKYGNKFKSIVNDQQRSYNQVSTSPVKILL
jgi:predicted nuclease with TOPRIM domain